MTLTNQKTDKMAYELTAIDKERISNKGHKAALIKQAKTLPTGTLVWLLVKRHKVPILAIGNIVLIMNYAMPQWPQLLLSVIGK